MTINKPQITEQGGRYELQRQTAAGTAPYHLRSDDLAQMLNLLHLHQLAQPQTPLCLLDHHTGRPLVVRWEQLDDERLEAVAEKLIHSGGPLEGVLLEVGILPALAGLVSYLLERDFGLGWCVRCQKYVPLSDDDQHCSVCYHDLDGEAQ